MTYLTEKQFDFRSSALPEDTFGVVDFKGFEGFSKPYEFEIMLVSSDPEIDMTEVLQNPAVFTILREEGDIPFNGILAQFEQLHAVVDHVFYRAVLVPRFWWLSLTHHNQIFLDKTVPEIIGEVLEDGGLTTDDYELRISNDYPKWEYICQYRESHQNFVSRWMEREGMYYFFEQTEKGEKLIITDTNLSHTPMAEGKTMYYSPPSGLEEAHREEVIRAVVCKQKLLPAKLHVNDYNYRKPSLSLSAEAEVLARGRGDVHIYGEHFRTPEEGQELARIRAEELLCHEKRFHGESTIPFLRPGYLFELQNHYRESFNQQYLTIELEHEGSQVGYLLAGIQEGLAKVEGQPYYRNSFVTIPSDVQYRHPKTTEKPSFNGTLNARVDAEGTGEYAELDDQGRYKVRLPFDLSGRNDGRASHWMRMAQPYAGTDHGMHFPLHKGTEVLLTFVEGDPDRPIIASAVPNPETASPVTAANQSESVIQTGGNNKIRIEDLAGSERIIMETPGANSWMRMGAPNDPPTLTPKKRNFVRDRDPGKGIKIFTEGDYVAESQSHQKVILDDVRNPAPQFQLSNDTIVEIHKALVDLKTKRDNDYNGIQEVAGKAAFEPKKLVDDDIQKIINYLDPNNTASYPPTTSNTGLPKPYTDKADFITKIRGTDAGYAASELNALGISNWGDGTFPPPEKQEVITITILQHAENDNAWKRVVDIDGEQFYRTDGCHKIEAINGDLKIEMADGGIVIDSGDKDVTIKCRKFNVLNELENNTTFSDDLLYHYGNTQEYTYGKSYSEHHGNAEEIHHGHKKDTHHWIAEEYFYGNKFCHTVASVEDFHEGHKLETFVGPVESFAFANTLELYGGLKEEISLAATFALAMGFAIDIKTGFTMDLNASVCIKQINALEWKDAKLKGESTKMKILNGALSIFAGKLVFNNTNLKVES